MRTLVRRSAAYAKLERFEEAVEDADEALRLDCEYAPAHLRKGVAALKLGNLADAEVALSRAVWHNPSPSAKKWLRKLRTKVATIMEETPAPPLHTAPPPPPGSDTAISESLSRKLQPSMMHARGWLAG